MDNNLLNDRIGQLLNWEQTDSLNEVLYGVLSDLNTYAQSRFDTLKSEIKKEKTQNSELPVIRTAVCSDGDVGKQLFWHPVSDTPPLNSPGYITTIFADCDYMTIQKIMSASYPAEIHTKSDVLRTQIKLRYSTKYLQRLQSLYYVFIENELPWATVNCSYFYKFLDIYSHDIKQDTEIADINIDFGKYGEYISYDKELLWNVNSVSMVAASCEPVPAYNTIQYEHKIKVVKDDESQYLVCSIGEKFKCFWRGDEMFVRTSSEQFDSFDMLRIGTGIDLDGLLYLRPKSNQRKQGYIDASARGRYIPTKGEAERIVFALTDEGEISLVDVKALPYTKETLRRYKGIDYNHFVETNAYINERKILLFSFKAKVNKTWAYETMFYALSELQLYFYEHRCVGEIL